MWPLALFSGKQRLSIAFPERNVLFAGTAISLRRFSRLSTRHDLHLSEERPLPSVCMLVGGCLSIILSVRTSPIFVSPTWIPNIVESTLGSIYKEKQT